MALTCVKRALSIEVMLPLILGARVELVIAPGSRRVKDARFSPHIL